MDWEVKQQTWVQLYEQTSNSGVYICISEIYLIRRKGSCSRKATPVPRINAGAVRRPSHTVPRRHSRTASLSTAP